MSTKYVVAAAAAALALAGTGCASTSLHVQKVSGSTAPIQGVRYSLPTPFLVVKPNPAGDGTFTVEVVYLPNEDETYAISARTRRGKYSLEVETKEGLLKKVTWNAEGSAQVGADSIATASELAKAVVDKREASQKEAETERGEAQKTAKAEAKAASEAVDAKNLALKLADLELASVTSAVKKPESPTAEEAEAIREARLKRDKAAAELDAAQTTRAAKQAALAAANVPLNGPSTPASRFDAFWGPVIYEIRDTGSSVDLVPVEWTETSLSSTRRVPQRRLETATLTAPTKGQAPTTASVGANMVKAVAVRQSSGAVVITLTAERPIESIDFNQINVQTEAGTIVNTPPGKLQGGGKQVVLTYAALAAGTYAIAIRGINGDGSTFSPTDLRVTVP